MRIQIIIYMYMYMCLIYMKNSGCGNIYICVDGDDGNVAAASAFYTFCIRNLKRFVLHKQA